eukprot:Hpha_TRINITY_DN10902_c0_g1::TRINITY_DN10902_c0_g1_i1::g.26804::m.26804
MVGRGGWLAMVGLLVGVVVWSAGFFSPETKSKPPDKAGPGPPKQGVVVLTALNRLYKRKSKSRMEGKAHTCEFFASAAAVGFPPVEVLGWGIENWRNGLRPSLIADYLRGLDPDTWVVFVDASDALFMHPPDRLITEAETLLPPRLQRTHLIVSSEPAGCDFPGDPKEHRCPNPGGWMGRASGALAVFSQLDAVLRKLEPSVAIWVKRDQPFFQDQYKALGLDKHVVLDKQSRVFYSIYEPKGWDHRGCPLVNGTAQARMCRRSKRNTNPWIHCAADWASSPVPPPPGVARLSEVSRRATSSHPGVLHFNGPAKHCMADALRMLPRRTLIPPPGATVALHRSNASVIAPPFPPAKRDVIPLSEFCPVWPPPLQE